MRALSLRFRQFVGRLGLILVLLGVTMGPLLLVATGETLLSGPLTGAKATVIWAVTAIAMAIVASLKYKRSRRVIGHEEIQSQLVETTDEYCLVLRPFGRDGQIIVPRVGHGKRIQKIGGLFTPNMTMEQLLATAAQDALNLKTYGIVDQKVRFAPPGVTFVQVPDGEWKMTARRLIQRAHSIFLILPPDQKMGKGFAWEIEQIVGSSARSRVIIVLPPLDRDVRAHQTALQESWVLLALLEGSGRQADLNHFKVHEYELQLSPTTLMIKCCERGGVSCWGTVPEKTPRRTVILARLRKKVVADKTYLPGLVEALKQTEQELSELGFKPAIHSK